MPYFVYLLQCRGKTLYCGWTNDLEKRLRAHNAGKASKYTRARLPLKLVYSERLKSKKRAMSREAEIKSLPRKKKLALVSIMAAEKEFGAGKTIPHYKLLKTLGG